MEVGEAEEWKDRGILHINRSKGIRLEDIDK